MIRRRFFTPYTPPPTPHSPASPPHPRPDAQQREERQVRIGHRLAELVEDEVARHPHQPGEPPGQPALEHPPEVVHEQDGHRAHQRAGDPGRPLADAVDRAGQPEEHRRAPVRQRRLLQADLAVHHGDEPGVDVHRPRAGQGGEALHPVHLADRDDRHRHPPGRPRPPDRRHLPGRLHHPRLVAGHDVPRADHRQDREQGQGEQECRSPAGGDAGKVASGGWGVGGKG